MLRWYVIQTYTGREEKLVQMVRRVVPRQLYDDCFVIYHEQLWRRQGGCQVHVRRVFPGYVFITSEEPEGLFLHLKGVPAMSRLLADGTLTDGELTFLSLSQGEAGILGQLMDVDHIIRLSYVATDGKNHVSYVSGPLGTYLSGEVGTSDMRHPDSSGASCPDPSGIFDTDHIKPTGTGQSEHSNAGQFDLMENRAPDNAGHSNLSKSCAPGNSVTYQFRKRYAAVRVTLSGEKKEIRLGIILNDDIRRELAYGKVEAPMKTPDRYHVQEMFPGNYSGSEMQTTTLREKADSANGDSCQRGLSNGQPKRLADFAPGDAVIVSEGILVGLPAAVCKVEEAKHQVRIRVSMFGRDLEMEMPSISLRKV